MRGSGGASTARRSGLPSLATTEKAAAGEAAACSPPAPVAAGAGGAADHVTPIDRSVATGSTLAPPYFSVSRASASAGVHRSWRIMWERMSVAVSEGATGTSIVRPPQSAGPPRGSATVIEKDGTARHWFVRGAGTGWAVSGGGWLRIVVTWGRRRRA